MSHRPTVSPRRRRALGSLAVGVIMVVAGVLFTANARLANDDERDRNLGTLYADQSTRLETLNSEVDKLQAQVDQLTDTLATAGAGEGAAGTTDAVMVATGRMPVTGPGVHIELNDAPAGAPAENYLPDQLVVHQQDIEAVLNALWRAGAEAITVQGQRMSSTTAVRCVGNVLLLGGQKYSPPYVIEAIGDPKTLTAGVLADSQVQLYLEWVDAVGLGWQLADVESIDMPGYQGAQGGLTDAHATVG